MKLDTPAIRRLRDRLLTAAPTDSAAASPETAAPAPRAGQIAAVERIAPLAEVLYLVMAADGEIALAERATIRNAIGVLTDDLLRREEVDDLMNRLDASLASQGRDARLEMLASSFALNKQDAEAAFSLAAAVALSDGQVSCDEQQLAEEMRRYFGIPERRAAALLAGDALAGEPR